MALDSASSNLVMFSAETTSVLRLIESNHLLEVDSNCSKTT